MAEITEFHEISTEIHFRLFLKILLNIFKLLFPKFSIFGGGRNQRNFAEILNTGLSTSGLTLQEIIKIFSTSNF